MIVYAVAWRGQIVAWFIESHHADVYRGVDGYMVLEFSMGITDRTDGRLSP